MTLKEFKELNGGKNAVIMVCQTDGTTHKGWKFNTGDMINVDLQTGLALYKQFYNMPGGGEGRRWIPKDASITDNEAALLNEHFEKEHKRESGEEPVKVGPLKIKSHKK